MRVSTFPHTRYERMNRQKSSIRQPFRLAYGGRLTRDVAGDAKTKNWRVGSVHNSTASV